MAFRLKSIRIDAWRQKYSIGTCDKVTNDSSQTSRHEHFLPFPKNDQAYSNSLNDITGKVNQCIVKIEFVFMCITFCYALSYFSFAFFFTPFLASTRLMNVSIFVLLHFLYLLVWMSCFISEVVLGNFLICIIDLTSLKFYHSS